MKQYKKQVDQFRDQVEAGKDQAEILKVQVSHCVVQLVYSRCDYMITYCLRHAFKSQLDIVSPSDHVCVSKPTMFLSTCMTARWCSVLASTTGFVLARAHDNSYLVAWVS